MTHSITLFDLVSKSDFNAATDAKLISIRDDRGGLRILNYTDGAMYTPGAWDNPAVRQCRGLVVDDSWRVVARPWAKFFNHGQVEAGTLDMLAPVEVTDKMDGSLGIIHRDISGDLRVATRGSFESDQAIHATDLLNCRQPGLRNVDLVTPLVEIVYPGNRIVVDYGDTDDLILLGGVVIATGEYIGPNETADEVGWGGSRTRVFEYATLADALAAPPRPGMEGLCVRYLGESRIVKIKQEEYVRLHRIVTGLSERTVWEALCEGKALEDLLGPLPDELHDWTREVWNRIDLRADYIEGRARDAHNLILDDLPGGWERRHYAEAAKSTAAYTPLLFQILDGRDPRPSILKGLKPAGDTRAKAISEAVA